MICHHTSELAAEAAAENSTREAYQMRVGTLTIRTVWTIPSQRSDRLGHNSQGAA